MKSVTFVCVVTPCGLVGRYRIFEGACCFHLHLTLNTSVLVVTKLKPTDLVKVKSLSYRQCSGDVRGASAGEGPDVLDLATCRVIQ